MELFETLNARHCYRGPFTSASIPREDLLKIAEAGRLAPTGKNAQTCSFVLIDDAEILKKCGEMLERPACMKSAKAAIAVIAKPDPVFLGHSFHIEDAAAATQNMLLAATALGYASVWVQGGLMVNGVGEILNKMLNVPEGQSVIILLPLGVPAEEGPLPVKKALEERITFNRF